MVLAASLAVPSVVAADSPPDALRDAVRASAGAKTARVAVTQRVTVNGRTNESTASGVAWKFDRGTFELGDAVMLPGYDDPTVMPSYGGERFLPSTIGKGRSSTQWVLTKQTDLLLDYLDPYSIDHIAKVFALPETHFGIGKGLTTICVSTPEGPKILDQALIEAVLSLDHGSPDPAKLGYGNTSETEGCR